VTVPVFRLKRWALGSGEQGGVYACPERWYRHHAQGQ
jgi:hypothetical protein